MRSRLMRVDSNDDQGSQPGGSGDPAVPRGRGRPRDPELERRALVAALEVFGESGWAALTIDEVALRARVGKSSIYLRWKDKAALLADALRQVQLAPSDESDAPSLLSASTAEERTWDTSGEGPLRDYLVDHAMHRASLYLGPYGLAILRLYVETRAFPEVFAEIRQQSLTDFVLAERRRVQRAIRDGELPPGTSAVQLLDAIEGAVFMHVLVTPPHLMDRVRQHIRGYVEQMVDNQLRAAVLAAQPSRKLTP